MLHKKPPELTLHKNAKRGAHLVERILCERRSVQSGGRFLDPHLRAMAGGREDPNEDVGRHTLGVPIGNRRHAGSRGPGTLRDLCVRERPRFNNFDERDGQVRTEFHLSCVDHGEAQGAAKFLRGPTGHVLGCFRRCHATPLSIFVGQAPVLVSSGSSSETRETPRSHRRP